MALCRRHRRCWKASEAHCRGGYIAASEMHRHRHFDIWLHDDIELAALVQSEVAERVTLREWPLSCVQRVTTPDGRRLIYKAQSAPSVESQFYAHAKSDLLPAAKTVYESGDQACMLIEFLEGPLIEDLGLPEEEVVQVGRTVMKEIAEIAGELPYYVDVSSEEKWEELVGATLKDLGALIEQGKFSLFDSAAVRSLERSVFSASVLSAIRANPGYIHADLSSDNLFVLPGGYRLIDWQYPRLGPREVDLALLLESLGFDPLRHVGEGVVQVTTFLRIHWLTQCAVRWIPEAVRTYDRMIAQLSRGFSRKL